MPRCHLRPSGRSCLERSLRPPPAPPARVTGETSSRRRGRLFPSCRNHPTPATRKTQRWARRACARRRSSRERGLSTSVRGRGPRPQMICACEGRGERACQIGCADSVARSGATIPSARDEALKRRAKPRSRLWGERRSEGERVLVSGEARGHRRGHRGRGRLVRRIRREGHVAFGKPNERVRMLAPRTTKRGTAVSSRSSPRTRGTGTVRSFSIRQRRSLPPPRRCLLARGECGTPIRVIHQRRRFRELSRGVRIFVTAELSKRRLNETESERGALRAARMLDEPLMRAPHDHDAVARSRSIYRCAHRRYPSAAPVASFLPHIVIDTPDLVSQNTQRRRRGVRRASPAQGLERKAQEPRKPRLRGHR